MTEAELDTLRAALSHWRQRAVRMLPDDPLAYQALVFRHESIVFAARLGIPDQAEVFATNRRDPL